MPRVDNATVIALAGLATTLIAGVGGPYLLARLAARQERRVRNREQRISVYAEAIVVATAIEAVYNWRSAGIRTGSEPEAPDGNTRATVDARMRMFATEPVYRAWSLLRTAEELVVVNDPGLQWNWEEEDPESQPTPYSYLDPPLVAFRTAIAVFVAVVKADVDRA